jgi:hypothetical protein
MWFSPTPNRIEAKRTKLFQNIARSKRNEQNCPKLNYMSVPIWDRMEGLTERGLRPLSYIYIYIEEVERKGLGRGVGPELPAVSFSYKFSFFL